MRVRSLIVTTIGAHSSVAFRDTFPILGKALKATASPPINQNLHIFREVIMIKVLHVISDTNIGGAGVLQKAVGAG